MLSVELCGWLQDICSGRAARCHSGAPATLFLPCRKRNPVGRGLEGCPSLLPSSYHDTCALLCRQELLSKPYDRVRSHPAAPPPTTAAEPSSTFEPAALNAPNSGESIQLRSTIGGVSCVDPIFWLRRQNFMYLWPALEGSPSLINKLKVHPLYKPTV